jgi:hypothetical protein
MPGLFLNLYCLRLSKALLCIAYLYKIKEYWRNGFNNKEFIIYNPNIKNVRYFKEHHISNAIFLVRSKNREKFASFNFSVIALEPLFFFLNLFGELGFILFKEFFRGKKVVINSDFGFDEISLVFAARKVGAEICCLQHGLFPVENLGDIDGTFCDEIIVKNQHQKGVLRRSGFEKKISVSENLFGQYPLADIVEWRKKNRPIIFVGSGYFANPKLKNQYTELLLTLRQVLSGHNMIYRPHPREKNVVPVVIQKSYLIDCGFGSSLDDVGNLVFVGVKSTMLAEAHWSGRRVFVLTTGDFPQYFCEDSIPTFRSFDELCYGLQQILH